MSALPSIRLFFFFLRDQHYKCDFKCNLSSLCCLDRSAPFCFVGLYSSFTFIPPFCLSLFSFPPCPDFSICPSVRVKMPESGLWSCWTSREVSPEGEITERGCFDRVFPAPDSLSLPKHPSKHQNIKYIRFFLFPLQLLCGEQTLTRFCANMTKKIILHVAVELFQADKMLHIILDSQRSQLHSGHSLVLTISQICNIKDIFINLYLLSHIKTMYSSG